MSSSSEEPRSTTPAASAEPRRAGGSGQGEIFRIATARPVAVLMIFFAITVFGVISSRRLPLQLMPEISYPKLTIRTEYPGAAPAEVENDVARPLEEVLGIVTGVTRITSVSTAGSCDVVLEFAWATSMDEANQDVLEKIDQIKPTLPDTVKQPLILRYDPTLDPVLVLTLSGNSEAFQGDDGLKYLRRIADRDLRRQLEPISGVAAVKVKGGLEEEILVELDEDALRRTNLALTTVVSRLKAENINLAGGSMRDGRTRYLVRTVNEFRNLEDLRDTVVAVKTDREIRLRDIALVTAAYKQRDVVTRVGGGEAVQIEIYKEADANIVEMAQSVRGRLEGSVGMMGPVKGLIQRINDEYGAELTLIADRSKFIASSVNEVLSTAIVGGLLAVLVLYLFLRQALPTAIVALSIPVSVLLTFAPMNLTGISLNVMSLGGLALGIGMLVDNSIVVLESISRCRQEGDDVMTATVRGVTEVGSAVVASTLTTVAVFFPMVFVEGVAGQMFGDLGLAVVYSLLASLFVAIFMIPTLSALPWSTLTEASSRSIWGMSYDILSIWNSVRELVESFQRRPLLKVVLIVPVLYILLRFTLHLFFELVGKVIAIGGLVFFRVGAIVAFGIFWVVGMIWWPVLWLFDALLGLLDRGYKTLIRVSLKNSVVVLVLAVGALVFSLSLAHNLDSELVPELHQGDLTVDLALPVGTPLRSTDEILAPVTARLQKEIPGLSSMLVTVGSERDSTDTRERGEHTARIAISLRSDQGATSGATAGATAGGTAGKDKAPADAEGATTASPAASGDAKSPGEATQGNAAERNTAAAEERAVKIIREVLQDVPDLRVNITRPTLFSFKTPVEVEIRGWDLVELGTATAAVAETLRGTPGLRDVKSSIQPGSPEIQITYDRDALARMNLDIRTVAELVRDKIQGNEATKFNRRDRKVPIRVRLAEAETLGVEELRQLVINPGQTRPIPLSAVASVKLGRGPNEIRRVGQQRVGVVTANIEGVGLGSASEEIRDALRGVELPASTTWALTGQSEEWETSSRSLMLALALSVFLVYVIMAAQFESVIYPLIILVSIPFALIGVLVALVVLRIPLSVMVFLGVILLAGVVVNNAIVLVDYVNQLKSRGLATAEAIETAGGVRLRPILMTTLTTVLGLLPMALGLGDGAEMRQPMAITVIAGLTTSTLLTLVVVPTLYATVDRLFLASGRPSATQQLANELAALDPSALAAEGAFAPVESPASTQLDRRGSAADQRAGVEEPEPDPESKPAGLPESGSTESPSPNPEGEGGDA